MGGAPPPPPPPRRVPGYSRKGNTLKEGQALFLSFLFGATPHLPVSMHIGRLYLQSMQIFDNSDSRAEYDDSKKNVGPLQFIISTVIYSCESCVDELLHGDFEQVHLLCKSTGMNLWPVSQGQTISQEQTHRML
jgi:hypothetical protein